MPARPTNATVGSLLGFLHEGAQSGWDLVSTAQRLIGDFWSLTPSQIYRELTAMAADGLIETDEIGPRERRAYRLTDAGRAAFQDWIQQSPRQEQIRYPLLLTLAFAAHLPAERLREFLQEHRTVHAAKLSVYRQMGADAIAAGAGPSDLITLDFGIRYETAVVEWFDHLPDALFRGDAEA